MVWCRFEILYEGEGFEEVPLDETNLLVRALPTLNGQHPIALTCLPLEVVVYDILLKVLLNDNH